MPRMDAAATVVLLRDAPDGPQVLLLERPRNTGSFAGAWVFPGGKVDPQDYGTEGTEGAAPAVEVDDGARARSRRAARRAGVRETREETGLVLDAGGLAELSCWIPPAEAPRRFHTWFFLGRAPEGPVTLNPGEHVAHAWLTPREALRRHGEGQVQLVPPTWVTLHGLLQAESVQAALAEAHRRPPATYQSRLLDDSEGARIIAWSGDADYEPGRTPSSGRNRLVMTRLPWVYERNVPLAG
ncbi:NUDIX hydrolase [Arthrobacter sp. I2-34]|uniref:NUDIX hydrolase n=1 Tax=Arthrobacter hankyongi TaxID=2904801 RepID=A0ABS9LEB6_9MICC|nr:NUDIX hydrolase [Arthrobacter hankyongi]MCG2624787.1 NUDIX hydrolase [Arthrobacter hankyongi]